MYSCDMMYTDLYITLYVVQCFPQGQFQTGCLMNINYLAHED